MSKKESLLFPTLIFINSDDEVIEEPPDSDTPTDDNNNDTATDNIDRKMNKIQRCHSLHLK